MSKKIKYAPLRYDRNFKGFFSRNQNKKYLIKLIKNYLSIDINSNDDIEFINTEMPADNINGKMPRADILIKVKKTNGEIVNIEIQVEKYYNLIKRVNYYNSKAFNEQLGYGEDYDKLKNVINLVFVLHDVFTNTKHNKYINNLVYTHLETGDVMDLDRRICFVELNKYKRNKELYEKDIWAELLLAEDEEEFYELEKEGGIMADAVKELGYWTKEQKDRYWDDMYKKAELDYISNINGARREGKQEGIAIGEVRGLLMADVPNAKIIELTGATEEEILEIKNKM